MQSLLTLTCSTPLTLCLLDIHYALLWAVLCSGAQSLCRIICSMVSGRCRHATVCVSNQLLPAQLQYTFYLQVCFTFCEHCQIHLLQTKLPDFFCVTATPPLHDHHIIFCELQHIFIDIRFVCWQTSGGGSKKRTMGTMQ